MTINIIGKMPHFADEVTINKWHVGFEVLSCPRWQFGLIRPSVLLWFFKITDLGEPYKLNGRPEKMKGGLRRYTSPIALDFRCKFYWHK